jgi:hypothetical protein
MRVVGFPGYIVENDFPQFKATDTGAGSDPTQVSGNLLFEANDGTNVASFTVNSGSIELKTEHSAGEVRFYTGNDTLAATINKNQVANFESNIRSGTTSTFPTSDGVSINPDGQVNITSGSNSYLSIMRQNTDGNGYLRFEDSAANQRGWIELNDGNDGIKVRSDGPLQLTSNNNSVNVEDTKLQVNQTFQGIEVRETSGNSNGYGVLVYGQGNPLNSGYSLFRGNDNGGTIFEVKFNGDVINQNGTYGTISDPRLKQDVTPASSQWQDVRELGQRFVNYRLKKQVNSQGDDAPTLLSVLADDDFAARFPGLTKTDDDGYRSFKQSVAAMKTIIAVSELIQRVEAMEAKLN